MGRDRKHIKRRGKNGAFFQDRKRRTPADLIGSARYRHLYGPLAMALWRLLADRLPEKARGDCLTPGLLAQDVQHDIDIRPVRIVAFREAVAHHAFFVDHEDHRMGDAVPGRPLGEPFIDQPEGGDDLCVGIRQQRVGDIFTVREARQNRRAVMGDDRQIVAQRRDVLVFFVPGDRLDLAVGSPAQRAGKQDDQPPLARK